MNRALLLVLAGLAFALPANAQENKPAGPKPDRVVITPRTTETEVGQRLTFVATGFDEANNKIDGKASAWFVAPFDAGYADEEGNVTFTQPGEARVGAMVNGKTGFLPVTIKPQAVARIDLRPITAPLPVGTGVTLSATTKMSNGDPRTDVAVKWTSQNPTIADVDESGFVSGNAPGSTVIEASAGTVKSSLKIDVIRNPVRTLVVEPRKSKVRAGDVIHFIATAKGDKDAPVASPVVRWALTG